MRPSAQAPMPPKIIREKRSPAWTVPSINTDDVLCFGRKKKFQDITPGLKSRTGGRQALVSGLRQQASCPRGGARRGGSEAVSCARLWAGRLPARSRDWSESGARRLPIGPQPPTRRPPRALGFWGLQWRRTVARGARASPCRTGSGVQGLISVGSWRPVPARAPQPNSMAIVRRPLCSGGGHFLQDRAGGGWQETKIRRPAWPGVLSRGLGSVLGLLGGWESRNVSS